MESACTSNYACVYFFDITEAHIENVKFTYFSLICVPKVF